MYIYFRFVTSSFVTDRLTTAAAAADCKEVKSLMKLSFIHLTICIRIYAICRMVKVVTASKTLNQMHFNCHRKLTK